MDWTTIKAAYNMVENGSVNRVDGVNFSIYRGGKLYRCAENEIPKGFQFVPDAYDIEGKLFPCFWGLKRRRIIKPEKG